MKDIEHLKAFTDRSLYLKDPILMCILSIFFIYLLLLS